MAMEHIPRKEARDERASQPEQDRASNSHRVGARVQQTRQRSYEEPHDDEEDEEQNQ